MNDIYNKSRKHLIRPSTLAIQISNIMLERINKGIYPTKSKLPSEHQLALELNVSRATVRSAFDHMEANGIVIRRHGIGTFVSKLSSIADPLNKFIPFQELITNNGYEPGFVPLQAKQIKCDPDLAKRLEIEPESQVIEVQKLFTANGKPIIFCINHIPVWVFENHLTIEEALQPDITEPLREFFSEKCNLPLLYYISSVRSDIFDNCEQLKQHFAENLNSPVLIIDEIGYSREEKPVHHSIEFHPGHSMIFDLVRYCD